MASHADTHHSPPGVGLGLDMRKLGMWTFIGSESLFFATLIANFFIWRNSSEGGLGPHDLDINLTGLGAFVLLMSSLTMVLALRGLREGNTIAYRNYILATAGLGTFFLGIQVYEFTHFGLHGLGMTSSMYGASFFVLTGFHGAHVFWGVVWLLALLVFKVGENARRPLQYAVGVEEELPSGPDAGTDGGSYVSVEMCGLYWHFVDLVWVFIFTLIYLLPAPVVGPPGAH